MTHHLFISPDMQLVDEKGKAIDKSAVKGITNLVIWVPSEQVTLLSVNIPTRNLAELEQSLPYAVEDELLEDIEQLHIAWKLTPRSVPLKVAIVHKEHMRNWLALLKPFNLSNYQMVPDVFALPFHKAADTPSMWISNNRAILRTGLFTGFAGSTKMVEDFVRINQLSPIRYHQPDTTPELNKTTKILGNTKQKNKKTNKKGDKEKAILTAQVEGTQYSTLPVYKPSKGNKEDQHINLLQGDFIAGASFSRMLRYSYAPLLGLALITILILSHQVVQYLILRKEVNYFDTLVNQRAQNILPFYTPGQPLKSLMERHVENQRQELTVRERESWTIAERAIPLLRKCHNCVYENISINSSGMQITLSSFSPLEGFEEQLKSLETFNVNTKITSKKLNQNDYYTLSLSIGHKQES